MSRLVEIFVKGGPVMWPILALSVAAAAILFWKALEIRAGRVDARGLTVVSTIITAEPMLGIHHPHVLESGIVDRHYRSAGGERRHRRGAHNDCSGSGRVSRADISVQCDRGKGRWR